MGLSLPGCLLVVPLLSPVVSRCPLLSPALSLCLSQLVPSPSRRVASRVVPRLFPRCLLHCPCACLSLSRPRPVASRRALSPASSPVVSCTVPVPVSACPVPVPSRRVARCPPPLPPLSPCCLPLSSAVSCTVLGLSQIVLSP